jgi:hypothetical protein
MTFLCNLLMPFHNSLRYLTDTITELYMKISSTTAIFKMFGDEMLGVSQPKLQKREKYGQYLSLIEEEMQTNVRDMNQMEEKRRALRLVRGNREKAQGSLLSHFCFSCIVLP